MPRKTEPMHGINDRIDVFLFFLLRIGIVEAQVTTATIITGQTKVQADRLGVTKMQIAVRLRRKAGPNPRRVQRTSQLLPGQPRRPRPTALRMLGSRQIGIDDVTDKIADRYGRGIFGVLVHSRFLKKSTGSLQAPYSKRQHAIWTFLAPGQ